MLPGRANQIWTIPLLVAIVLCAGCTGPSGNGDRRGINQGIEQITLYQKPGLLGPDEAWNGLNAWARSGYPRPVSGEPRPVMNLSAVSPEVYFIQGIGVTENGTSGHWLFGIGINTSGYIAEYASGAWTLQEMMAPLPPTPLDPAVIQNPCPILSGNNGTMAAIFSRNATPAMLELRDGTCTISSRTDGVMHSVSLDLETGAVSAGP